MSWRLEDSGSVIHPVVGCSDTQNWVRADRLRGPGRAVVAGWMAAETVEPGTIYLVDLVGSTRLALRRQRRSVVRDQRSSSPASRSAIGTDRRVERSDLPSVECSPRTNASRTRMGWIVQSTSRQRRPSSSDWRRPVVAAARISTRRHGSEDVGRRRRRRPGPPLPAWLRCANDHVVGDRSNHCVELLDGKERQVVGFYRVADDARFASARSGTEPGRPACTVRRSLIPV